MHAVKHSHKTKLTTLFSSQCVDMFDSMYLWTKYIFWGYFGAFGIPRGQLRIAFNRRGTG